MSKCQLILTGLTVSITPVVVATCLALTAQAAGIPASRQAVIPQDAAIQSDGQDGQTAGEQTDQFEIPTFEEIQAVVKRSFATQAIYEPGDLITSSQVETALEDLQLLGWAGFNKKLIMNKVQADNAFLARQLRTDRGFIFMRKISSLPQAYDKLDRLSRMPQGRRTVVDLTKGAGGDEFIVYLTTAKGGEALGEMLGNGVNGKSFNKPTGVIYTVDQLLEWLKKDYERYLEKHAGSGN